MPAITDHLLPPSDWAAPLFHVPYCSCIAQTCEAIHSKEHVEWAMGYPDALKGVFMTWLSILEANYKTPPAILFENYRAFIDSNAELILTLNYSQHKSVSVRLLGSGFFMDQAFEEKEVFEDFTPQQILAQDWQYVTIFVDNGKLERFFEDAQKKGHHRVNFGLRPGKPTD